MAKHHTTFAAKIASLDAEIARFPDRPDRIAQPTAIRSVIEADRKARKLPKTAKFREHEMLPEYAAAYEAACSM